MADLLHPATLDANEDKGGTKSARSKSASDADSSDNGNKNKDEKHCRTHFLPPERYMMQPPKPRAKSDAIRAVKVSSDLKTAKATPATARLERKPAIYEAKPDKSRFMATPFASNLKS